ncbi:hypothetical protein [Streptomyces sp. NPDC051921]|uniref:hypothetical protein n=1 Tax=Streptomyces sp. NPDC051921 TaxID=3155806 RepID=UPI0034475D13
MTPTGRVCPEGGPAYFARRGAAAEVGEAVQDRAGPVGQQDPVAVGEPVQRVAAPGHVLDPFGEAPVHVAHGGREPLGIGVEQVPDLGRRHAGPGKGPDLPDDALPGRGRLTRTC